MELEVIDISRDEKYNRPRARSASNGRKAPRPERQNAAVTVKRRAASARTASTRTEIEVQDYGKAGRRTGAAARRAKQAENRRRKRRRRKIIAARMATLLFLGLLITCSAFLLFQIVTKLNIKEEVMNDFNANIRSREVIRVNDAEKPIITEDFIPVNDYSRPGEELPEINNIFVHYTANPKTSAAQNRSYFENLGITGERSASAHFVIGYDGEIIQCIPLDEIAYAVLGRNYDSVSIECCYLSEDGKFTDNTYYALIRLSAWLLKEYNLAPEDMRRHYDEGGKKCPLYFVEHEDAWEQFLKDLEDYIMNTQV